MQSSNNAYLCTAYICLVSPVESNSIAEDVWYIKKLVHTGDTIRFTLIGHGEVKPSCKTTCVLFLQSIYFTQVNKRYYSSHVRTKPSCRSGSTLLFESHTHSPADALTISYIQCEHGWGRKYILKKKLSKHSILCKHIYLCFIYAVKCRQSAWKLHGMLFNI